MAEVGRDLPSVYGRKAGRERAEKLLMGNKDNHIAVLPVMSQVMRLFVSLIDNLLGDIGVMRQV